MHVVVVGASGGIGSALTEKLSVMDRVDIVHALSRSPVSGVRDTVRTATIDLNAEDSIAAAAADVGTYGQPDLVIVATGMLTDSVVPSPEKSMRQQSLEAFQRVFAINTFGPALVAKHFLPILPRTGRTVFAALSARVGSISDNRLGGWHAYRASKAALNMLIRNYAIEQSRRNQASIVVGLHPGTVDTALSEPFQGGVPERQLFSPDQAAGYLLDVIARLTPEMTGKVFDWAGQEVQP